MIPKIYTILKDTGTFTGIGERLYPVTVPQGAIFPAVTFDIISKQPSETKTGSSTVDQARVQIDFYASTLKAADELAEALRTAIDFLDKVTVADADFDGIKYISQTHAYNEEQELFQVSVEYYFRFKR